MSILSSLTGIHISKKGVHIEPLKALGTALTVGSFGGLGPLAGIAGKVGSVATKIPGVAKVAGGIGTGYNTLKGAGVDPLAGKTLPGVGTTDQGMIADARGAAGVGDDSSWLDKATGLVKDVRKATGAGPITLKNTLGGLAKKVGGAIMDNPLETIGGTAAGANAIAEFKRGGDLSDKALQTAEQSYSERAPLRQLGVAGMSKNTAQAPQEFINTANPFAKRAPVVNTLRTKVAP